MLNLVFTSERETRIRMRESSSVCGAFSASCKASEKYLGLLLTHFTLRKLF